MDRGSESFEYLVVTDVRWDVLRFLALFARRLFLSWDVFVESLTAVWLESA